MHAYIYLTIIYLTYCCGQLFPSLSLLPLQECMIRSENATCPDKAIEFLLFSGDSYDSERIMIVDPSTWLNSSIYNTSLPTVVLVHGFSRINGMEVLRNAYVTRGTYNVIVVDWVALAPIHCYLQAVNSLKGVAKCTAHLMAQLEVAGVDTETFTCVGHSLGAHVCGLVANYVPGKLERIVALDPARPLMQVRPPADRLDATDAKVVQVVHSSAGYYGLPGMQGTADFCVNFGLQPYCQRSLTPLLCSHFQAICFYAESLDPEKARVGFPCAKSCPQLNSTLTGNPIIMGEYMEDSAEGMYCLVAKEAPYCKNTAIDPDYGDPRCCP